MSKKARSVSVEAQNTLADSPFGVPVVASGYPLDDREEKAIDRVLEEAARGRDDAESDKEAA